MGQNNAIFSNTSAVGQAIKLKLGKNINIFMKFVPAWAIGPKTTRETFETSNFEFKNDPD